MKLATLKDASRDGKLVVVSSDLAFACEASAVAATLQQALENWSDAAPRLARLSAELNAGRGQRFAFDAIACAAPLPRAYQWLDGSAFVAHGDLMTKAFKLERNVQEPGIPLVYQGASDDFLGPCDDAPFVSEADGIDFEAEYGVIVGDTEMAIDPASALDRIALFVLVNDWSLRALAPREMRTGFGFLQSKPSTSFAPVAVTADELGDAWTGGRINLPVLSHWNDKEFGHPSGAAMSFDFGQIIAHAARTRRLRPGTIVGSGTVSEGKPETVGSSCIAERRGYEMIVEGGAKTQFLRFGDRVRIDVRDAGGQSIFGAIDQKVVAARPAGQ